MSLQEAHRLIKAGEPDQALAICNDVLNRHIDDEDAQKALFMSAYIMMDAERYGLAYNLYRRCAELNPKQSQIWSNMGMCLEDHDTAKARKCFQKARKLDPTNANAWGNEGLIDLQEGDPEGCATKSRHALGLDPSMLAPKHNLALALLMLREWDEGWRLFYETLGVKHREKQNYGVPDWEGQRGRVLVYGEQGVGDEIMYASCIPDLLKTNEVILDCDARLESLFRRSFDCEVSGTRFTGGIEVSQPFDYQCAIGQLPYFYRRQGEFPGTPYLKADPEQAIQWRALFDTFPGRKIGIAWTGGRPNTGQEKRSMSLTDLEPLFNDDDTFISLEYRKTDPAELKRYGVKSYPWATGKGKDIDHLAALIGELDLVVTACTTVVYVAGALGIPCHVLVPDKPGYRYHSEGGFPWYDSVTLHRQNGTWRDTVADSLHWL